MRHSGLIVGVVVILLVALVGTAVALASGRPAGRGPDRAGTYRHHHEGRGRLKALDDLAAKKAPENMRYSIYLMQAEFAMQDQDYSRAEQA